MPQAIYTSIGLAIAILGRIAVSTKTSARLLSKTYSQKKASSNDASRPLAKKAKLVKKTSRLRSSLVLNLYSSNNNKDNNNNNLVKSQALSNIS